MVSFLPLFTPDTVCISLLPLSAQCPAHIYAITQRVKFKKHLIMTFSPTPRYFLLLTLQDLPQPRTAIDLCASWTGQRFGATKADVFKTF